MNKTITNYILDISCKYDNLKMIQISYLDYLELRKAYQNNIHIDLTIDKVTLKSGLFAHVYGIPIYVSINIHSGTFQVNFKDKWSTPIKFDNINNMVKILQLQTFC